MKKLLCKPCAVALEAKGKTVKQTGWRCEKITCSAFGVAYDVTGRITRSKKEEKA